MPPYHDAHGLVLNSAAVVLVCAAAHAVGSGGHLPA
jgi:hypothetical protein